MIPSGFLLRSLRSLRLCGKSLLSRKDAESQRRRREKERVCDRAALGCQISANKEKNPVAIAPGSDMVRPIIRLVSLCDLCGFAGNLFSPAKTQSRKEVAERKQFAIVRLLHVLSTFQKPVATARGSDMFNLLIRKEPSRYRSRF